MSSVKKHLVPIILFLFVSAVYIHNLSRATYGGDVGDLLAAAVTMGVPHAPGYPLFTFLGFLFSRINLITPAFMVGLVSVLSGALGILLFYILSLKFTKSKIISIISSLILAFSYYFWFYSEIGEVFALNNFFAIILFLLAFTYSQTKNKRYLLLLFLFAGLSLTNHQTIVLIFPSLLIIVLPNILKDIRNLKTVLACLVCFVLGLLPYLYIPIASSHHPPINWDNVHDLDSFLYLVLRKDYGTFSIGHIPSLDFAQRIVSLKIYLFNIITQATIPVIVVCLLGAFYTLRKNIKFFLSVGFAFILSGPFFITYAGFSFLSSFGLGVYERFVILSFIIMLMFFPFGLLFIKEILERFLSQKEHSMIIICVFFIVPLLLFKFNYQKTNLSTLTIGDDLIYDLLRPLPKNSVIFLSGDSVVFNSWYVHFGRNFRPDVQVVNMSGLRDNPFYRQFQDQYYKKFPSEKNDVDSNVKIIVEIAKTHDVFAVASIQPKNGKNLKWIPYGLSYKLFPDGKPPAEDNYLQTIKNIWINVKGFSNLNNPAAGNFTASDIFLFYSQALERTGTYLFSEYKDNVDALGYYQKSLRVYVNNSSAFQAIGSYYLGQKNCALAKLNLDRAIEINPYEPLAYFFIYYNDTECFNNQAMVDNLLKEYNNKFKSNLLEDLAKTVKSNGGKL
jgi:hypothetical protein